MINEVTRRSFQTVVWKYYHNHGRHDLPWRQPAADGQFDPYAILVSEIMLQQTQVARVLPKYQVFMEQFSTLASLASAPQAAVLRVWNGLGYNRRARFLHQAAQQLSRDYAGQFPRQASELTALPGIGPGTAGAILAYAFNQPASFIETNIRTVFIHYFFNGQQAVSDQKILKLIEGTLDRENPREWYWALMDYGSQLKQTVGNLNRQSRTYARQAPFAGSRRLVRGQVIRLLGDRAQSENALQVAINDERLNAVLRELTAEKLIHQRGQRYSL